MEKIFASDDYRINKIIDKMVELNILDNNDFRKYSEMFCKKQNEWEQEKREIDKKCKILRLHLLWNDRIGELLSRCTSIWYKNTKEYSVLNLYMMQKHIHVNIRLERILGRTINIINKYEERKYFWLYFILNLDLHFLNNYDSVWSEWEMFLRVRCNISRSSFPLEWVAEHMLMTREEENEGERKAVKIGIKKPFVCIFNRDSSYLNSTRPNYDWSYHNYRDSKIECFRDMIKYCAENKLKCVRMGRVVSKTINHSNCVDYANLAYDELMDIWLAKHCSFWVGDESGINLLPRVFNKLCLTTNVGTFSCIGYENIPLNPNSLYIFKRYYSMEYNRLLTLEEMLHVDKHINFRGENFAKFGIRLIDNTASEIRNATADLYNYMCGNQIYDKFDLRLQQQFQYLLRDWQIQCGYDMDSVIIGNVAPSFIRNNQYLLDRKESEFLKM
jgi:putative glycosyltransferase (TIGR04372 family)